MSEIRDLKLNGDGSYTIICMHHNFGDKYAITAKQQDYLDKLDVSWQGDYSRIQECVTIKDASVAIGLLKDGYVVSILII